MNLEMGGFDAGTGAGGRERCSTRNNCWPLAGWHLAAPAGGGPVACAARTNRCVRCVSAAATMLLLLQLARNLLLMPFLSPSGVAEPGYLREERGQGVEGKKK